MTAPKHTPGPWVFDFPYIVAPDPTGRHPDLYIAEMATDDEDGVAVTRDGFASRRKSSHRYAPRRVDRRSTSDGPFCTPLEPDVYAGSSRHVVAWQYFRIGSRTPDRPIVGGR